jgi:hypothetical protein
LDMGDKNLQLMPSLWDINGSKNRQL